MKSDLQRTGALSEKGEERHSRTGYRRILVAQPPDPAFPFNGDFIPYAVPE
jgi:hypothetical protein